MFALTWKEIQPNGNQPIHLKSFRTEDARTDFIDTLYDSGQRFEITSMNTAGDPTLEDFLPGMRVRVSKSLHTRFIGKTGTVIKTIKKRQMVLLRLDDGDSYCGWPWNLTQL